MVTEPEANSAEVSVEDEVNEPVVDTHSDEQPLQDSEESKLLTKEQADALFNERQSKLDKRIFELEKQGEQATKAIEAATKRAEAAEKSRQEAQKRLDDVERQALGDSPEAINLFDAKIAHKAAEDALEAKVRQFEEEKAKWEGEVEKAKEYATQKLADDIASEYEVESKLLVTLTDGSREKMEALAKSLPKKTAEDRVTLPRPPDSGRKAKVLTNPTVEQLNDMTMEEYADYVAERDKLKR